MDFQFESFDALVTVAAIAVSVFTTWLIGSQSRVTTSIFWNGLLSLFSGLLAFSVAISSEMDLKWQTGDSALDELLGMYPLHFIRPYGNVLTLDGFYCRFQDRYPLGHLLDRFPLPSLGRCHPIPLTLLRGSQNTIHTNEISPLESSSL